MVMTSQFMVTATPQENGGFASDPGTILAPSA